ncbi:hypothetical protein LOK49_LG15G02295 [Camellia lanceoleosa]|uniref:Uncharacterized protein n=1 Tax=Camellia lanceoleosa TaxID=1840588 RepID=A0ACC0F7V0_9ERIC|nr:hypothetical protein LOK49_LG15G02295 [Camellia lanceoleosa]
MYFNQNKEGGMFRLVQFQSSDEAKQLYGALMRCRHPNLAHVLQFTVEGEGGFFLAFRKQGTSLKDILEKFVDVKKFYEDNRITPFYQKILTCFLTYPNRLSFGHRKRRLFSCFWNFIKGKSSLSSVMSISPFGESVNVIENDPILRQIKQHVDNYESQFGKDPYVSSVFDTRETEVRNNLALISKCLSHFHELKITSLGLKNEDEVAKCFEKAFKDYIGQLYKWALIFEASSQVKLLPRKTILSKLYKEP